MKKADQTIVNTEVLNALEDMYQCKYYFGITDTAKMRSCNAKVLRTDGYIILQSYNTIVACICEANKTCYDFSRYVYGYTNTTAQHIRKFCHDYNASKKMTYYPVN